MRVFKQVLIGLVIVGVAAGVCLPARAQMGSGLTDEQLALIDRVARAHDILNHYSSFAEESSGHNRQEVAITIGNQSGSIVADVLWSRSGQTVRIDEAGYVQANITITVDQQGLTPGEAMNYTVNAEARRVDQALYVTAAYADPVAGLPPLPEGWIQIERDPDNLDVYEHMELGDILNEPQLIDEVDLIKAAAADVTIESGLLDDGTPVDTITIYLDRDGLVQAMIESEASDVGPGLAALLPETMSAQSSMTMTVVIDAEDNPITFEMVSLAEILQVDASLMAPGQYPENTFLDFLIEASRLESYSQVGEPLPPATIPEELAQ